MTGDELQSLGKERDLLAEGADEPVERPRAEEPQRHILPIDQPILAELPLGLQVEVELRL